MANLVYKKWYNSWKRRTVGGIHGDDIKESDVEKSDLYKRFAESQGANRNVDTTGHRI